MEKKDRDTDTGGEGGRLVGSVFFFFFFFFAK